MHGAFLLDYGIRLRAFMGTLQGKGIRLVALSCLGVDHRIGVGRRLQASIRASDVVARFGGDEFAVVLSELDDLDNVRAIAQKLIDAVGAPYVLGEVQCNSVGVSIGIAWFPDHGTDMDILLQRADQALYASKRAGRRRYTFYNDTLAETEQA